MKSGLGQKSKQGTDYLILVRCFGKPDNILEMTSFWEVGPIFGPGPDTKAAAEVTGLVGLEYIFNPEWRLALGFAFSMLGKNSRINYTPVITLYKPLDLFKRKSRD